MTSACIPKRRRLVSLGARSVAAAWWLLARSHGQFVARESGATSAGTPPVGAMFCSTLRPASAGLFLFHSLGGCAARFGRTTERGIVATGFATVFEFDNVAFGVAN